MFNIEKKVGILKKENIVENIILEEVSVIKIIIFLVMWDNNSSSVIIESNISKIE